MDWGAAGRAEGRGCTGAECRGQACKRTDSILLQILGFLLQSASRIALCYVALPAGLSMAAAAGDWTPAQQKQLEVALAAHKGSALGAKEKWKSIAAAVDGKGAKACIVRFKQIRSRLLKQTSAAQPPPPPSTPAATPPEPAVKVPQHILDARLNARLDAQEQEARRAGAAAGKPAAGRPAAGRPAAGRPAADRPAAGKPAGATKSPWLEPRRRGIEVKLQDFRSRGVSVLRCSKLRLQVKCTRCSRSLDAEAAAATSPACPLTKSTCSGCSSVVGLRFQAGLVHQRNTVLGYLDIEGGTPLDMLPSDFLLNCEAPDCAAEVSCPRVLLGHPALSLCRGCHAELTTTIGAATFVPVAGSGGGGGGGGGGHRGGAGRAAVGIARAQARRGASAHDKAMGLVAGKPLPNNGSCAHYRRSHRWMRFPCCGKARGVRRSDGGRMHFPC